MTDPIADMLTRIRNASAVNKAEVLKPFSNVKFSIAKVLEKEKLDEIFQILGLLEIDSFKLDINYSEKNEAEIVGELADQGARLPHPEHDV